MPSLLLLFQSPHLRRERSRSRDRGARGRGTFYAGARGCFFRASFSSAFPPTITSSPVSLSLSLGSAFLSFYVYITINDYSCSYHLIVLRGVCVSAARVARPTEELSRALNFFCGKKKEKRNQKKSSKVLLLLLLLLQLRLLLLLILLEFSVFVFVFDFFIIELVKVFKFGQTSLDPFLPL